MLAFEVVVVDPCGGTPDPVRSGLARRVEILILVLVEMLAGHATAGVASR
jgi:hypothetical protein